jgi:hypothetical protein
MRELNGRVPAGLILSLWLAGVVAASLGAYLYWLHLREWMLRQAVKVIQSPEPARAAEPNAGAIPPTAAREIRVPVAPARIPPDRILALTPARAGARSALRA